MEVFLILLAFALAITGIIGGVVPILPGPIISVAALITLHFAGSNYHFTTFTLIIWITFSILVTLLDYIVPAATTQKMGGSKQGSIGSIVGLIAGIFLPPISLILGAYLGAFVGELIAGKNLETANKSALGSLLGLLLGTFFKVAFSICVLFIMLLKIIF